MLISSTKNRISFLGNYSENYVWIGSNNSIAFEAETIKAKLLNLDKPCYFVSKNGQIGVTNEGYLGDRHNGKSPEIETLTAIPPLLPQQLGDRNFLDFHKVKYAYMTGSMANGIASEELVIALGKENILSSFGAAGLVPERIKQAIKTIQNALPNKPYCFNLIHSPSESVIEKSAVDLYLKYEVNTVEASAFLDLTPNIVYYRVAGLSVNSHNEIEVKNKVISKVSRREVATKFMQPAPTKILKELVNQELISELQAKLASFVPMADDITVEADSGGHTDNRPLVCLLPSILALREEIQLQYNYNTPIRVGAAGGIGTPHSALGAFVMGADYIVTGSINQSCIEAACRTYQKITGSS